MEGFRQDDNKTFSYKSLLMLYQQNITVKHISEVLVTCNLDESNKIIADKMKELDFDVLGVEQNDCIIGYIKKDNVEESPEKQIKDSIKSFNASDLISDSTPLVELFQIMRKKTTVFILEKNKVSTLVTRADLQKPPVRMLIFGLISLLEMCMLKLVRKNYHNETWIDNLKPDRVEKAKDLMELRLERNEAMDLADCLQICDKATLIVSNDELRTKMGFKSKKSAKRIFELIEQLRDKLAHSQDLILGWSWDELFTIVDEIEELLENSELIINENSH